MDITDIMTGRTREAYEAALRGDLATAQEIANELSPGEYELLRAAAFRDAIDGRIPKL
ncbi:hypothetical protein ACWGMA_08120 [Streptomyces asiaticus]